MVYVDSTVLVKLYVNEPESDVASALVQVSMNWLFTSVITKAEVLAALVRANRDHRLGIHGYDAAKIAFLQDWEGFRRVDVTANVLRPIERIVERHGLRGFDATHLCTALFVGSPDFACYDKRLRAAAAAEGLRVLPLVTDAT
jgi:predicted nucleic acid-binding protein